MPVVVTDKACMLWETSLVFDNLQQPLPADELDTLVSEYRNGIDHSEVIIKSHMKLAMWYAGRASRRCPQLIDELISCCMVVLVKAVRNFPSKGRDNNITAYISTALRYECIRVLTPNDVQGVSISKKSVQRGRTPELALSLDEVREKIVAPIRSLSLEAREIIDRCCSEEEKQILRMELEGYNIKEMTTVLGLNRNCIARTLETIFWKIRCHYVN